MRQIANAPEDSWFRGRFFLLLVLAVAASLRLWRLGEPSLWFDEVLVAMAAKLPVQAIFERLQGSDIHPPAFYLLAKLFLLSGDSDAALRLPLALAGMAGVWLSWWIGRGMVSERAGLFMAAACAVLPWQVLLSRQLRPYSLIFVFCLLGLAALLRAVKGGRVRDAALAGLALWVPMLLHYATFLAMGGAGCVLLASWLAGGTGWRHVLAFAGVALVPVAADAPFLMTAMGHEQGVLDGADRLSLALLCLEKIGDMFFREPVPWARAGLAFLAVFGLMRLWRRDRAAALVSAGWLAFPLCALVILGYGSYFNPWHLTFLAPVLVLWLGCALEPLPAWTSAVLCLGAAALYFGPGEARYYRADSNGGTFKQQAQTLLGSRASTDAYVYPMNGLIGPINWYLDRFSEPNPVRRAAVGPDAETIRLVTPGEPGGERILSRTPLLRMGPLPFRIRITGAPDDFLSKVHAMEYMACQPVLEDILVATQAGRTGHATFVFENGSDVSQRITVHFGFSNKKPGNRFAVMLRFDDEPWAAVFESVGPDARGFDKLEARRDRPFRRLTVRFELARTGLNASFTGEDLEAVRMLDFKVEADAEKK